MSKSLCTDVRTHRDGLKIFLEVRLRGNQISVTVMVPWKWIASTDAIEHIEAELTRRGKSRERAGRPWLPLESWE